MITSLLAGTLFDTLFVSFRCFFLRTVVITLRNFFMLIEKKSLQSSSSVLTRPHPFSPVLIRSQPSSPVLIRSHPSSSVLIRSHLFSLVKRVRVHLCACVRSILTMFNKTIFDFICTISKNVVSLYCENKHLLTLKFPIMRLEIIIKKENVTLYHKSVTADKLPSEVLVILEEVHNCHLEITRKD